MVETPCHRSPLLFPRRCARLSSLPGARPTTPVLPCHSLTALATRRCSRISTFSTLAHLETCPATPPLTSPVRMTDSPQPGQRPGLVYGELAPCPMISLLAACHAMGSSASIVFG